MKTESVKNKSAKTGSMKSSILLFRNTGIAILMIMGLFSGCRGKTQPVVFYTLSPMQEAIDHDKNKLKDHQPLKDISLGVGPVSLPVFLNKPQIVTRSGSARISYAEFHRWGGNLDREFLRVMAENLSVRLSTDQVKTYPWAGHQVPMFQVDFDVKQFDGEMNGEMVLNVIWQIWKRQELEAPLVIRRSVIREPVNPSDKNDYEALVAAQSRMLGRLSDEIAEEMAKY